MDRPRRSLSSPARTLTLAAQGLRTWGPRQVLVAAGVSVAFGLLLGLATVLIPNPVFTREIPPVWWNYPVWILTSVLSGMLVATYVRGDEGGAAEAAGGRGAVGDDDDEARRTSRVGVVGAVLAWFAVGCPVCNKLALLALGYSGAITWFAPVQPVLAILALALTGVALAIRLRGQVACVLPAPRTTVATR
ncbi:hypothetical protein [Dietzia sp. ANT_WB102]|uniref:hypothetical protein n=1 Tax=Dietzia sp. ANT_WB102 TaxID=2597345 RepID=UPI0011EC4F9E|nr:hypothetical protein [Dietzia sp. ANT_WB102]KAA0919215.1 hypothetical protein FQ137_08085 [Dietzia sp. ANT_WB102]